MLRKAGDVRCAELEIDYLLYTPVKAAIKITWWTVLALLVVATLVAWRFEARFSRLQHDQLHRLGEDVTSNQEKWKNATISDQEAFFWWKDLDVGHRITMETATLKQLALLGIVLQLGITLAVHTKRCNSSAAQPDGAATGSQPIRSETNRT